MVGSSYTIHNYTFRYAPKDKFIRTPYGKVTINSRKSVFYTTIVKYWDIFDSNYSPLRVNFSYFDIFETPLGKTSFNLNTDWINGDIPIVNLYEGRGNAKYNDFLNFGVGGLNNFENDESWRILL